ncbi:MAG: ImmA/IrrE family metallo-endopeptidase [Acaryochloris sp. RU_4_1]|nr:ImmA/IrrE family metallo-endopeptidase [Leptolyngbyaceae cyanobacterium SU_3_3]NJM66132.1 ImmA/IrrE family metallo-endopeptidase [Acaryochloris sp. RU_4_1]NJR54815.1 ImmA/IrrE family metallo-endopeptidase [Acaryochloris sp. CRU_2_0]
MKPIRTGADYETALQRIDSLMEAEAETPEADELEVLATLVELYEEEHFPIGWPNPIEAIRFRMEQAGLSARDLVPLLGSRAKVSEVLSGKRFLTLQMIRALHEHLGIPADVLLRQPGASLPEIPMNLEWSRFPLAAMAKLGWIESGQNLKEQAEEIVRDLMHRAGGPDVLPEGLYRKNDGARHNAKMDAYALKAWCYQLLAEARVTNLPSAYRQGAITQDFARNLVRLSALHAGPRLAKEFLANDGIHLIYLPHLPRTHLDGAALMRPDGTPVIGLTLRYDRLDNFWFCLCHELAHVALHLQQGMDKAFFDDLSLGDIEGIETDDQEAEADRWAQEALIPAEAWAASSVKEQATAGAVVELARELGVHPAIVAGRVRKELHNYRLLTHYVGNGEVRKFLNRNEFVHA